MVVTRGSQVTLPDGDPSILHNTRSPNTIQDTISRRQSYVLEDDSNHRVVKKRRTGSSNAQENAIRSLPSLPQVTQEESSIDRHAFDQYSDQEQSFYGTPAPPSAISDDVHFLNGERSRSQYEARDLSGTGNGIPENNGVVFARTGSRMKVESLPILDNLSTQILSTLAKLSYQEIVNMVADPDSEAAQEYTTVRSLFDHSKRVYSTIAPFLSPAALDLVAASQVDILRKANLATFVSSLFGTNEISLTDMNDHFLDIFVPEGGRLLKAQASLLLDLKTQAFIAAVTRDRAAPTELLQSLFSDNLEKQILSRRPGARGLAPSEYDFVKRVMSRRDILAKDIQTSQGLEALPEKYHWEDFLRDVSTYISKNFENINAPPVSNDFQFLYSEVQKLPAFLRQHPANPFDVMQPKKVVKEPPPAPVNETHVIDRTQLEGSFPIEPLKPPIAAAEASIQPLKQDDFVAKAARAAQIALQGHGMSMSPPSFDHNPMQMMHSPSQQDQEPSPFQQYQPSGGGASDLPDHRPSPQGVPHYSQTAPTQVLYERARMAATAKASPTVRRPGLPSQRRPWTSEEENALMAGLDRVRGPHWSQILAMFGPGGTINESLKDRNQVQLKDKARNLKLFFLKSGIEVPYYLKYVTGDLKTRAPGQASRHEARERERQQGAEDKAHFDGVQGIMALAHPQYPENETEGNESGGDLPESAEAAYHIMGHIQDSMVDQPLDPNLSTDLESTARGQLPSPQHELPETRVVIPVKTD